MGLGDRTGALWNMGQHQVGKGWDWTGVELWGNRVGKGLGNKTGALGHKPNF